VSRAEINGQRSSVWEFKIDGVDAGRPVFRNPQKLAARIYTTMDQRELLVTRRDVGLCSCW
jgi:hypothetical protein